MQKNNIYKICAYILLALIIGLIPNFVLKHIRDTSLSYMPEIVVVIAVIPLILFLYNKGSNSTKTNITTYPFNNTLLCLKWSGIFYDLIIALSTTIIFLFYILFSICYLITGDDLLNPNREPSVMQGVGWIILAFIAMPTIIITPIIFITNLIMIVTDLFLALFKRNKHFKLIIIDSIENSCYLTKHSKINMFLTIIGILSFLSIIISIFLFIYQISHWEPINI